MRQVSIAGLRACPLHELARAAWFPAAASVRMYDSDNLAKERGLDYLGEIVATDTHWELMPHTEAKHRILTEYLKMWFPVLARYRGRIVLLDGFAGPGSYSGGEPGSPLLVLRALLDHSHLERMSGCEFLLIFNEMDKQRFAALERVIEAERQARGGWPANVKVVTVNQGFQPLAEDILETIEGKQLAPTFAFLDPFGYSDVPISLISRLLAFQRCELFIYFDYNSVNRFATADTNVDRLFEALYGTDEFKNAPPTGQARKDYLVSLYERQLHEVCGFEYVQSFEMLNHKNRTGNYMIFCTRSIKGLDGMKSAMWKVAPTGDFRFADRLAHQEVLVGLAEPDTGPLQDALLSAFGGSTVPIETVMQFVIIQTPYVSSHVKRRTLLPMQKAGLVRSSFPRAGQFPDGTTLEFSLTR